KFEDDFIVWAKGKPEFENIFSDWAKAYDAWRPYSKHRVYINEGIFGSPLLAYAASLQQVENALVRQGLSSADIKKAVESANESRNEFLKGENKTSDQNIVATVLQMYYNAVDKSQHPIGFFEALRNNYGDLKDPATFKKYAAEVF